MSGESLAEKVYEAGIELVNPGGRPDVLRAAAKGWRTMGEELAEAYGGLDRKVQGVLGEHWRGESAEAFRAYWKKIGDAVHETVPLFGQAAKGLEEAADNIEEINEEIHQIYLEIGVSIAASAALSFVTLGFSAPAGAANALRLAAQAADAASKLGRLLNSAARVFRYLRGLARGNAWLRLAAELSVQWGAGTGTGIVTSLATDNGPEYQSNAINGAVGVLGGKFLTGHLASTLGGGMMANAVDGATVGVLSSVAGDTVNTLRGKQRFDGSQLALGALAGGLTGTAGSVAVHRATDGRTLSATHSLVGDVATNAPIGLGLGVGGNLSKQLDGAVNGDPNADAEKERPGAAADSRKDATEDGKALREWPDTQRYGVFG
ncbi:WXG100 family type VII secretion target [Streptomyces sp. NPDC005374]|uniref:WXG100 family type VII secretion target n=1 Tax=Streptomyces sp. NPDC005374 TaxID=3364713 RepID=UPI0036AD2D7A